MNLTSSPAWSGVQTYCPVFKPAHRYRKGVHQHAHLRPLVAAILSAASITTYALPTGGQVSAGQGDIAQSGSAMTVNQQSQNLAINWQTFNIGATESVTFAQPNASAIALNRVLGADPSQIYGRLSANGQVWLLNPNGVLFGGGAQVNVGGLVASTLNISDADFLAGKRTFAGSGGTVTNQGSISAADGGYVAMLGGKVSNEGVIQARLGTVALGAGNQVTLDFAGDKLLNLQVDQGALNALAQNKQLIQADGGTVLLSARAADTLLNTVVNNTGIIEAHTIDTHSGTIKLLGGMDGGTVQVGGTLDASAPNGGNGGFIEASGAQVKVNDGSIVTTSAPYGQTGEWLIDPTNFLIAPSGGDITGAALGSELNSTNVTILSSNGATTGSGDVKVNDNVTWNSANNLTLSAYNNIKVVKTITNLGTGGVTLRADDTGNCVSGSKNCGTVSFTPLGHVTVNGGAVNIYYNPAGSSNRADANGNGPSYANPTDYSGHVSLNGSTLYAWMLVNDVNQLEAMNTNLTGDYALGRSIDASATAGWNGGAGFVPVGTGSLSFTGMFDGSGHVISGLAINRPATSMVGLFGANSGSIANVGLADASVLGSEAVGALVGYNFGGAISNSYSTGSVNGTDNVGGLVGRNSSDGTVGNSYSTSSVTGSSYEVGGLVGRNEGAVSSSYSTGTVTGSSYDVGGLVGDNFLGTVSNSYSTGSVNGTDSVGGLVGSSFHGTVSNSHSTGSVNGIDYVGGLIGSNAYSMLSNSYSTSSVSGNNYVGGLAGASAGTVSNSYSTGAVSGNNYVGGLLGENDVYSLVGNSYSTGVVTGANDVGGLVGANMDGAMVRNSYSTGAVSGSSNFGGLVGLNAGTVSNSYWDITTSGQTTSAGGTGLTDTQMKQQASFVGFDFVNTWGSIEGVSYPFLLEP